MTWNNILVPNTKRSTSLEEAQAGIKISGRNINNLRNADDTTSWQKVKRTKEPPDDGERGVEKFA